MSIGKKYKIGIKVKINDMVYNANNLSDEKRIEYLQEKIKEAEIFDNNSNELNEWKAELQQLNLLTT